MKTRALLAAPLLAMLILAAPPSHTALAASATVQVQATIRPYLKFSASMPASSYRVTTADLERGYVDLPRALRLNYQTNIRDQIHFEIASGGPEQVVVSGNRHEISVPGATPGQPITRDLDLRVLLPAHIAEGTYPLQIALAPVAY